MCLGREGRVGCLSTFYDPRHVAAAGHAAPAQDEFAAPYSAFEKLHRAGATAVRAPHVVQDPNSHSGVDARPDSLRRRAKILAGRGAGAAANSERPAWRRVLFWPGVEVAQVPRGVLPTADDPAVLADRAYPDDLARVRIKARTDPAWTRLPVRPAAAADRGSLLVCGTPTRDEGHDCPEMIPNTPCGPLALRNRPGFVEEMGHVRDPGVSHNTPCPLIGAAGGHAQPTCRGRAPHAPSPAHAAHRGP